MYFIFGQTEDGETIEQPFILPSGVPSTQRNIYLHAVEALWKAQWAPGSILWRVVSADGIPLNVGENYSQ